MNTSLLPSTLRLPTFFLLLAATGTSRAPSDELLIAKGQVGRVQIGMTIDLLKQRYMKTSLCDLQNEGLFTPALEVWLEGGEQRRSLVAEIEKNSIHQWVVWRVQVEDPKFLSVKGIHVGSSVSELKTAYPSLIEQRGEGRTFLKVKDAGLSFELDDIGPAHSLIVSRILVL